MKRITFYSKNHHINSLLRGGATPHLALFTTLPNLDTGVGGVEATGGGYERMPLTFTDPESTPGLTQNSNEFAWVKGTNLDAATYVGMGIMTAATDGNLVAASPFDEEQIIVEDGDGIVFTGGMVRYGLQDPAV
jgi:hypothetical protein